MPAEQPDADDFIEYPDQEQHEDGGARGGCEICGSADSLAEYSLASSEEGDGETIVLCATHYQVAAILSGDRYRDAEQSSEYDLQETRKITVRVPRALIESADSAAEQQGQTRSEFVRDGIQMAIELQEIDDAFEDILSQAVDVAVDTEPQSEDSVPSASATDTDPETDVEFLKERIRTLESLLEDSIGKI